HRIWLPPGKYRWRFVTPSGQIMAWQEVEIKEGHKVTYMSVTATEGESGEVLEQYRERELARVVEDLVLDWHNEDGADFSWHEAEDSIIRLCKRTPGLRQVTFSRPTRPDLMIALQRSGIYAFDTMW